MSRDLVAALSRLLLLSGLLASSAGHAQSAPSVGTTPFVLDGNRTYARLAFVRADGSIHDALAFIDMGSAMSTVVVSLRDALGIDEKQPLAFRVGAMMVHVPAAAVTIEPDEPYSVGADLKVEAMLAAGLLQKYQVTIDYRRKTLTLAEPGSTTPEGVGVPFRIHEGTGLIAVDAAIDGKSYAVTIDNGSAYTWFRQSVVREWLVRHPDWQRGVGAVGTSNMMMSGDGAENTGILLRVPKLKVGSVRLGNVGVFGAAPGKGVGGTLSLFDWYSTKNAVPVIGWIGGNVLKGFKLTIDYPNRRLYWLKQAAPDLHELDQVGITLRAHGGEYFISAIASKNGKPAVAGVFVGDKLLQVDQLQLQHANWGAIYAALHGAPGDVRRLLLDRAGRQVIAQAKVTAF